MAAIIYTVYRINISIIYIKHTRVNRSHDHLVMIICLQQHTTNLYAYLMEQLASRFHVKTLQWHHMAIEGFHFNGKSTVYWYAFFGLTTKITSRSCITDTVWVKFVGGSPSQRSVTQKRFHVMNRKMATFISGDRKLSKHASPTTPRQVDTMPQ